MKLHMQFMVAVTALFASLRAAPVHTESDGLSGEESTNSPDNEFVAQQVLQQPSLNKKNSHDNVFWTDEKGNVMNKPFNRVDLTLQPKKKILKAARASNKRYEFSRIGPKKLRIKIVQPDPDTSSDVSRTPPKRVSFSADNNEVQYIPNCRSYTS
jgi:hypothetical protein